MLYGFPLPFPCRASDKPKSHPGATSFAQSGLERVEFVYPSVGLDDRMVNDRASISKSAIG